MELADIFISPCMIRPPLALWMLTMLSCQNPNCLTLSDALKSNCFWDRTNESGGIGGLNSCYRFLADGQCFFYYYNFYNHKITDSVYRFEDNDLILPSTWTVKGDTSLIARGTLYKVLSFTKDSIMVEGYLKDTMI